MIKQQHEPKVVTKKFKIIRKFEILESLTLCLYLEVHSYIFNILSSFYPFYKCDKCTTDFIEPFLEDNLFLSLRTDHALYQIIAKNAEFSKIKYKPGIVS